MLVIPALLRQEDPHEFKVSLGYRVRPHLKYTHTYTHIYIPTYTNTEHIYLWRYIMNIKINTVMIQRKG
jgi:hypothetical protein